MTSTIDFDKFRSLDLVSISLFLELGLNSKYNFLIRSRTELQKFIVVVLGLRLPCIKSSSKNSFYNAARIASTPETVTSRAGSTFDIFVRIINQTRSRIRVDLRQCILQRDHQGSMRTEQCGRRGLRR